MTLMRKELEKPNVSGQEIICFINSQICGAKHVLSKSNNSLLRASVMSQFFSCIFAVFLIY